MVRGFEGGDLSLRDCDEDGAELGDGGGFLAVVIVGGGAGERGVDRGDREDSHLDAAFAVLLHHLDPFIHHLDEVHHHGGAAEAGVTTGGEIRTGNCVN